VPPPDSSPLDLRTKALTQNIADWLAWGIGNHPQDWHMLQKLWLAETVDEPLPGESLEWTPSLPHAVPPQAAPLYGPSQA
jgi:KDO2-lipid IV(A) lauroyltransferase